MKAIAISSANDASVAVAEYIHGTEERFIKKMNQRASELEMKGTYFYNTNGLPSEDENIEGNYTTAYDLALLTRTILEYPKVFEWTSTWIDYLRNGEFVLNNTNRLVRHYNGADGLKTGYTSEAKFCVTSTAERDDLRFISIIMGAKTSQNRFDEAAKLLSYGFNIFDSKLITSKGELIKETEVWNARNKKINIIARNKMSVPIKKGKEKELKEVIEIKENIKAPLDKGAVIGKIKIFKGNLLLDETDLITDREVEKASFIQLMISLFKILINKLVNIFS
jgi:D-alanyl-D-alanine carboxypeptidase (penicillin-binding protein 5/6)